MLPGRNGGGGATTEQNTVVIVYLQGVGRVAPPLRWKPYGTR